MPNGDAPYDFPSLLEAYREPHEPIPLSADDLLIKFDDSRLAATVSSPGRLATRTHVNFITHHEQLVELKQQYEGGPPFSRIRDLGQPKYDYGQIDVTSR